MNCRCGEKLETQIGSGYTIFHCPKGHYERHEADGDKLKDSKWAEDVIGWFEAKQPAATRRVTGTTIADKLVSDAIAWANDELAALQQEFPDTDLRLPSWRDGQAELEKLSASSSVLEIRDAIEKYKQRVNAYLGKWRKKLQSQSGKL